MNEDAHIKDEKDWPGTAGCQRAPTRGQLTAGVVATKNWSHPESSSVTLAPGGSHPAVILGVILQFFAFWSHPAAILGVIRPPKPYVAH